MTCNLLRELAGIYVGRGVAPDLATEVAARGAMRVAHAAQLGLDPAESLQYCGSTCVGGAQAVRHRGLLGERDLARHGVPVTFFGERTRPFADYQGPIAVVAGLAFLGFAAWTLRGDELTAAEADKARNVTRNGIHVVTEKYADFYMSNPAAGYTNAHERWAVRISNNGEFIHANPKSTSAQGNDNVLWPMRDAHVAGATGGEVSDALREVWGKYVPQDVF